MVNNKKNGNSSPEKKLSGEERLELHNSILQDEIFNLRKKVAILTSQNAKMQEDIIVAEAKLHEAQVVTPLYEKFGLKRGQQFSVRGDGSVVIDKGIGSPKRK